MNVSVEPGKYVVAVSGGVDSVALLHLLAALPGLEIVVAHFDHGIRPDSHEDTAFVRQLAAQHGLLFVTERVELGAHASEAEARSKRYDFLARVQKQQGARAIITAHHQDDLLETVILNIMRGTGRRGLSSLQSTGTIVRPLLSFPKKNVVDYALKLKLSWREDTTNYDERYTRNYIRHRLLVRFDATARQQLLTILNQARAVNDELDALLTNLIGDDVTALNRRWFCNLPHLVSKEVLMTWLRANGVADFDARGIERLTVQLKVKPAGKALDVLRGHHIAIEPTRLVFVRGAFNG